jgi:hypothetical protein
MKSRAADIKWTISRVVISMTVFASVTTACSSIGTTCDCADPSVTLHVPTTMAQPGNQVTLSGSACQGVVATCTQNTGNGCLTYSLQPVAAGNCHVDVTLPNHTFSADITIKRTTGCCAGLYADPVGTGDVQVTSLR